LDQYPTAKQFAASEQDTPFSVTVVAPAGVGLATIDHVVPFHCSINVFDMSVVAETSAVSPTATQLVGLEHDTPSRSRNDCVRALGLATIDQPVPFQRSINDPFASDPTAKQSDGLEHDTADSWPFAGPGGLTLGTTDHLGVALDVVSALTTVPAINMIVATIRTNVTRRAGPAPAVRFVASTR